MTNNKPDTQQVEIMGRNLVTSLFVADGVEVSMPLRDRGIDLIVYDDSSLDGFKAVPVQLKASSGQSFSINRKYEKFPNLLMAFVWNVGDPLNASIYILGYQDSLKIAGDLGWTKTSSWLKGNEYTTQKPSRQLRDALEPFKYCPGYLVNLVH